MIPPQGGSRADDSTPAAKRSKTGSDSPPLQDEVAASSEVKLEIGQVFLSAEPGIRLCVIGGIRGSGVHSVGNNFYSYLA